MPAIHHIENWRPYQHILRLRDGLLASWVARAQAGWDQKPEREVAAAFQLFLEYRTSLKVVAEYSRAWGLDPTPCYQFAEVDQKPESRFFEQLRRQLAEFILKCVEEAEVQWRLVGGERDVGADPEAVGIKREISKPGEWLKYIPRRFWEPFYRSAKVMNLLPEWYELTKRLGHHTDEEHVQYLFVQHELADALSALSVRAQTMGLNADPIYKFRQFDGGKTLMDIRNAMGELTDFIHRYEDTAEAQYQILKAHGQTPDDLCPPLPRRNSSSPTSAPPAPAPPALPPLDEEEWAILNALGQSPTILVQADLEAATNFSRNTLSRRLKRLRELGLTHRPKGERGGEGLTDRGRELLNRKPDAA